MARTHGHGNPKWTRDETILALALYQQSGGKSLSHTDPRVKALSEYLRALPYDGNAPRNETYRNPDSVAFKLLNIRALDTGKGLKNTSAMDRRIWNELGTDHEKTGEMAERIRKSVALTETASVSDDDDLEVEFAEGRMLTRLHRTRERSRKIRIGLLSLRKKSGALSCDLCGIQSTDKDNQYEDAIFEAHHILPVAQSLVRTTRLSDMALLCANCHRLAHRYMAKEKQWFSLPELKRRFR